MKVQNADQKRKVLTRTTLFQTNHINFPLLCKELAYETTLELPLLKQLIDRFKHIVDSEPNLLNIDDPALVIGDIHGQFYDLIKILSHANAIRGDRQLATKLVFLGDYVDRGINAIEVMVLLICLKIQYPDRIFLLRGNHQSRIMTAQYNFKSQCCIKYSQEVYELMMQAFDLLPLACLVNNSYFCVHGGISDKMIDIKKINTLQRKMEIPVDSSPYCDFIWSDPTDNQRGNLPISSKSIPNQSRDCSIVFGAQLVKQFLTFNELSTVIRGHEVFLQGFKTYDWSQIKPSPSVITIFSAPNYCGTCGNKAAVLKIENNAFKIKQFKQQQPQKYKFLVKFDVFTWTLPQIMKNVREIVLEMMQSIIDSTLPQLKQTDTDKKLNLFINYAIKEKLIEPSKRPSEVIRQKQFLTVQQERNYLFNRSHQYYAQFQKVPKHH